MKLNRCAVDVMVCSCNATRSGKGYMLTCIQSGNPIVIFSERPFPVSVPETINIIVDINCYYDSKESKLKEFISVSK